MEQSRRIPAVVVREGDDVTGEERECPVARAAEAGRPIRDARSRAATRSATTTGARRASVFWSTSTTRNRGYACADERLEQPLELSRSTERRNHEIDFGSVAGHD